MQIGTQHKLFGVIDSNGFAQFEYRELEGTNGDKKPIFADDDYFAGSEIATVSLPPAIFLFGSGLLGLIGVTKKRATRLLICI